MSLFSRMQWTLFFCGLLIVEGCAPKAADMLVARIGDNGITLGDYERLYEKSNGSREKGSAASQEEREKFLDLMTKFRLKLADAYRQGLDKNPGVLAEIQQYKGSLAAAFLTDREVTTPAINDMHRRRQEEIRASHVLISLAPNASAEDSARAYSTAYGVIEALRKVARFDSLAEAVSNDPSAKQNKGDLYYFTVGQMTPPFEDAAYSLKPGEYSTTPVKTRFGLHIIYVHDRKPASGERECSHIMIRFPRQDPSPEDTLAAFAKITLIRDSLKLGYDFAALAIRHSEDPGSASEGGRLGRFSRRRWIQPFDGEAFKLKKGEVSGIVRTVYGYHIIKCNDVFPLKPFDELKKELQQTYQQQRFQDDLNRYVAKLKAETGFTMNQAALREFIGSLDSSKTTKDSAWWSGVSPRLMATPIMMFGKDGISVDSLTKLINTRPDQSTIQLKSGPMLLSIDKIAENLVFARKAEAVERTSPEFAAIMKEYKDGILLYELEQDMVWNRISVNDSLLQLYFSQNNNKFVFPDRIDISEINVSRDSVAHVYYDRVVQGETLEQLGREDSTWMARRNSFRAVFRKGSSALSKQTIADLKAAARDLVADANLRMQLISHPDTASRKAVNEALARKRTDAIKAHLTTALNIPQSRITLLMKPVNGKTDTTRSKDRVDVDIVGRRPNILRGVQTRTVAVTDELTRRADSLAVGQHTPPFVFKGNHILIRLNRREPSRLKTFEEAGTEVSSAFQEYESKRLEQEWLNRLRRDFPVVEHKEVLKNAFAPAQ